MKKVLVIIMLVLTTVLYGCEKEDNEKVASILMNAMMGQSEIAYDGKNVHFTDFHVVDDDYPTIQEYVFSNCINLTCTKVYSMFMYI